MGLVPTPEGIVSALGLADQTWRDVPGARELLELNLSLFKARLVLSFNSHVVTAGEAAAGYWREDLFNTNARGPGSNAYFKWPIPRFKAGESRDYYVRPVSLHFLASVARAVTVNFDVSPYVAGGIYVRLASTLSGAAVGEAFFGRGAGAYPSGSKWFGMLMEPPLFPGREVGGAGARIQVSHTAMTTADVETVCLVGELVWSPGYWKGD